MLRLTILSRSAEEVVLLVDGWLTGDNVRVLERESGDLLGATGKLVLILQGVRTIDREGIELLRRLAGERTALRGGSSYVRVLLETHGLLSEPVRGTGSERPADQE